MPLEQFLSVKEVRSRVFPTRSERWVTNQLKAGAFGRVVRDGGGWLIPESGIQAYLDDHQVSPVDCVAAARPEQRRNLLQFAHV